MCFGQTINIINILSSIYMFADLTFFPYLDMIFQLQNPLDRKRTILQILPAVLAPPTTGSCYEQSCRDVNEGGAVRVQSELRINLFLKCVSAEAAAVSLLR